MRVYLPATFPLLGSWLAAGEATPPDDAAAATAYAVTPALRESYYEADLDELEHAAQVAASIGSLELLAADTAAMRRRVVVAAEVAEAVVSPDPQRGPAAVRLAGVVPVRVWSSALIDAADTESVVAAAIAGLASAAAGDEDSRFAIDEAEAHELGWYAVQELPHLFA